MKLVNICTFSAPLDFGANGARAAAEVILFFFFDFFCLPLAAFEDGTMSETQARQTRATKKSKKKKKTQTTNRHMPCITADACCSFGFVRLIAGDATTSAIAPKKKKKKVNRTHAIVFGAFNYLCICIKNIMCSEQHDARLDRRSLGPRRRGAKRARPTRQRMRRVLEHLNRCDVTEHVGVDAALVDTRSRRGAAAARQRPTSLLGSAFHNTQILKQSDFIDKVFEP